MSNAPFKLLLKRNLVAVLESQQKAISFAAEDFRKAAITTLQKETIFTVALSGGSTPKMIFEKIAELDLAHPLHWRKIHVFFGDERAVPPTHPDSNYYMAYKALLSKVPIPEENIHRMKTEEDLEKHAEEYEQELRKIAPSGLHYIMLGIGEDGHTASLFPNTKGLDEQKRLVIPNWIESKQSWRMTLTYPALMQAKRVCVYALGSSKSKILKEIFATRAREFPYPIERVGTPQKPLYWVVDADAFQEVNSSDAARSD